MIFLTVGTYPMQFDRCIRLIDEFVGNESSGLELFAQIGCSSYEPKNFPWARMMEKAEFDHVFQRADAVIAHAGMGSITMALDLDKPMLVIPRLEEFGEHVNDHQLGTALKFGSLGHVLVAHGADDLPDKVSRLWEFKPAPRKHSAASVAERVALFINQILGPQSTFDDRKI